ncbi:MAG: hypothetical protein FJ029_07340 [Actinobacteria bacterium]|nr:hypothetical protein [Actinomycetota bacterium]
MAGTAWRTGGHYRRAVLAYTPWTYVALVLLFSVPPVAAIVILASHPPEGLGLALTLAVLNFFGTIAPPVMFMMAVAAGYHRERRPIVVHLWHGATWLPRYLWTNLHTSVIFWAPMGSVVLLFRWYLEEVRLSGPADAAVVAALYAGSIVVGLYVHARTLLAPFLAVHGNLPGTLAALGAWRLGGRYFPQGFGTMVVPAGPVVLPIAGIIVGVYLALRDSPDASGTFFATLPAQMGLALNIVRPVVVTATYGFFQDYWPRELRRRAADGTPPTPWPARALVTVSWWPVRAAEWLLRRPLPGPL